jgi:hypothetical protein
MPDSRPSIAEFSSLVEKLATLLPSGAGEGGPASPALCGELCLRGRPLGELLRERWPYAQAWAGRPLSQGWLDAAHRLARQDRDGLLAEIAQRKREMARGLEGLKRAEAQAAAREAKAAQTWNSFLAAVPRLQAACLEVRARLRARREEAAKLEAWLKRVEPHGLNRYRHPQGRVFDRPFLTQTVAHLQEIRDLARRDQRRLEVLTQSLARARARREAASLGLDQAQADARQFQAARQRKALALQRERAEVGRLETSLAERQRELGRLTALRLLHGRALAQAGALLAPALAPRAAGGDPLAAVEEHRLAAGELAARAARLQGVIGRLEKRLQRRAEAAGQGLKQARELNREIVRLEEELPRIVGPLTSPEGAQPQMRANAAAQLSTLLPRLNELLPQALELRQELDLLRSRLTWELDRGRAWVETWRETAKAERASLALAQALLEEAGLLARQRRSQAQDLVGELAPLVEAMGPVLLTDLLPGLAAAVELSLELPLAAAVMETAAGEMARRLGPPTVPNLAKPPAALKPYSTALRRLAGRKVEVERLQALMAATANWQHLLSEPLAQAIRQPVQEVALRLSGSLAVLAAERARLSEGRGRAARRLLDLRRELHQHRQSLSLTRNRLRRTLMIGQEQRQRLKELSHELEHARRARHAEQTQARERISGLKHDLARQRLMLGQARDDLLNLGRQSARQQERIRSLNDGLQEAQRRLAEQKARAEAEINGLSESLATVNQVLDTARGHLRLAARRHARQKERLRLMDDQLSLARQGQLAAGELAERVKGMGLDVEFLERRLGQSHRLAGALKLKAVERHRLYRQAQAALTPLTHWREEALRAEREVSGLRAELAEARRELERTQQRANAARVAKDQLSARLANEQEARAREALDLLQGQTLAVELAATQTEAGRWAALAMGLSQAMAAMGQEHQGRATEMTAQIAELSAQVGDLKRQLQGISLLVAMQASPQAGAARGNQAQDRPLGMRVTMLTPNQMDRVLDRLTDLRSRLRAAGRSTLGHWAIIAALTAGLSLLAPQSPSVATRRESPLMPPREAPRQTQQSFAVPNLNFTPTVTLPAEAARLVEAGGRAELEINLLPLRKRNAQLSPAVRAQVESLARQAGLSPQVLITSARAVLGDREAADSEALQELADTASNLAQRHPLIFKELAKDGLPASAQAVAALEPAPERAQHLFLDRLYREYRALGFSAEESLGALAANERAADDMREAWAIPGRYSGLVRPVTSVEAMGLEAFLGRITPYIESKVAGWVRSGGTFNGDVRQYARNLAFDIYCAAKKFEVPVSLMLVIAHQESSYANVLGDSNRSSSPFQIFEPTRRLIAVSMDRQRFVAPPKDLKLEHHLTMATYMAAFHLRELLQGAITNYGGMTAVDMDLVLKRYNGSNVYIGQVAARQAQLIRYLGGEG